jgi:sterol 14alpha-demethylase
MRQEEDIPTLEGGLPFLGHALAFHQNPVALLQRGRNRFGDLFRFRLFGKMVHVLTGSTGNEAFFRAPDDQLSPKEAYRFTVPIFGRGVAYDVSPELMDEQLRLLHPAFCDARMQAYAGFMQDETESFLAELGNSGEIDLPEMLDQLTTFIAGRCLIGNEFRQILSREFADLYHDLEGGINLVAFFSPNLPLPAMRRRDRARERLVELIAGLIRTRKANENDTDDFLSTLMAARFRHGGGFTDEEITGMLLTLLFAGKHTSAVLASWVGVLLIQHPEWAEAARRESEEILYDGKFTLAALKRLSKLERCIKEAERLYPPLVMLMRTALRDLPCLGRTIPAGSLVMVSPAVTHRMPEIFVEPDRFDPDRYAPPRAEDRQAPYSLIGFGGGKHRCIGLAFAYQQVKVIWSLLLTRFELELADAALLPDYKTFVVGPRRPCRLRYRARHAGTGGGDIRLKTETVR